MTDNTRPSEISESELIAYILRDSKDHIMPLIVRAAQMYLEDPIAIDQLSYLSRECAKTTSLITLIYSYRLFNGNRSDVDKFIDKNPELRRLESEWNSQWSILANATPSEIADLHINAIHRLSALRDEVYFKCGCFQ